MIHCLGTQGVLQESLIIFPRPHFHRPSLRAITDLGILSALTRPRERERKKKKKEKDEREREREVKKKMG
jgi:hypothetical protein